MPLIASLLPLATTHAMDLGDPCHCNNPLFLFPPGLALSSHSLQDAREDSLTHKLDCPAPSYGRQSVAGKGVLVPSNESSYCSVLRS